MKFSFAGIKIDNLTMEETLERIENWIENNETHYIVTPNAAHIVLFQKDESFRNAYKKAGLILADGQPIVWISKILGTPLKERITGTNLLISISKISQENGYKIFLLGATEEIIAKVRRKLLWQFPRLQIGGTYHGYFSNDDVVIKEINKVRPDILFIGIGFGKQERWIYHNIDALNIRVAVCIGGVFDVISGKTKRAPKWMQRVGLEWFFRLVQEPKRLWKRYLIGNTIFVFLVLKELFKRVFFKNKNV